jgi:hypothetical protein
VCVGDQSLSSVCLTTDVTSIADGAFVNYNNNDDFQDTASSITAIFIPS